MIENGTEAAMRHYYHSLLSLASKTRPKVQGFTLIEVLIVSLLIFISLSIALPSFYPLLLSYRISNTVNAIERGLREARQEAVVNNQTVVMCPSANGQSCALEQNWSNGFLTFIDVDKDSQKQALEETVQIYSPSELVVVQFNRVQSIAFNGVGRANTSGTFIICDLRQRVNSQRITLIHSGRMRRSTGSEQCG